VALLKLPVAPVDIERAGCGSAPDLFSEFGKDLFIIETAFNLTPEHLSKDLGYLSDEGIPSSVQGIVWICETVHRHSAGKVQRFVKRLNDGAALTFIVLKVTEFAPSDARYRFAVECRFGPAAVFDGGRSPLIDKVRQLADRHGRIDTPTLAETIGVTAKCITGLKRRSWCPLLPLRNGDGKELTGPDGRYFYSETGATHFIRQFESRVATIENCDYVAMISANEERVLSGQLVTLTNSSRMTGVGTGKLRGVFGSPTAFCIAPTKRGYSPLYPAERLDRLKPSGPTPR
jgi:hypothetical protein